MKFTYLQPKFIFFIFFTTFNFSVYSQQKVVEQRINQLLSKMTLEEKVGMIHANSSFTSAGVARLGIPELVMSDGPHGVRPEHGRDWNMSNDHVNDAGTYLPTGNALAATWNPKLGYEFGSVLGSEANARGKDVILGPGINIIRTPLNGRNFEYLSEDPFLISKMAVGYIKGVQDQGVSASLKHFIANNQETDRTAVNVEMSERALREIYLPGFKAAVIEGGVNTVMGAYNKFRGQWATHNYYLVNKILKGEWGFEGFLMSDWGAVHHTNEALYNGTDLEMGTDLAMLPKPNYGKFFMGDTVVTLVNAGKVPIPLIDDKVRRILRVMFKTGMMDKSRKPGKFATKEHQQTALKIAEEAIVLLKNKDQVLPLNASKIKNIAVIGTNATKLNAMGGGSSQVKPTYEITPLMGIENYMGSKAKVTFAKGYEVAKDATANQKLVDEAVKIASTADQVVFVGGWVHGYDFSKWDDNAFDAEGIDKKDLKLPFGQAELIKALLKVKPNLIIMMMGGGPVEMNSWIDDAKVVIEGWYPGMEGGNALANVIFGKVNPSGKLPMTFPKKLEDSPAHKLGDYPGVNGTAVYHEDIFVGYRYFDTYKVEPQFAFGHGLSYTKFKYDKMEVVATDKKATISLSITNTGKIDGAEVVQFYVHQDQPKLPRPEKELKAFQKVFLKAGETQNVEIELDKTAFHYYDDQSFNWVVDGGKYQILVGSSSRDIRQQVLVEFKP
ncbi:glycoside hydrolase family 3 C-terminal domain-containing protein [Pedobacter sp. N36a]|uniref:glycoside hydrolase family 3 C-terminal domain-containing protein n=1 Tax=Pedobacter sp. N36a TaxID=2767996 RepID=UPI0016575DBE|nr:glycoside hydrolase family 3 C-terminal domain-containing protein [Pedobacter sp. N36a]MBC8988288.1 glycoside hydrolase family 3 C-terminal domain-containing protein [Pedobacter sp. N36a]